VFSSMEGSSLEIGGEWGVHGVRGGVLALAQDHRSCTRRRWAHHTELNTAMAGPFAIALAGVRSVGGQGQGHAPFVRMCGNSNNSAWSDSSSSSYF
jgi:hypothetical protein